MNNINNLNIRKIIKSIFCRFSLVIYENSRRVSTFKGKYYSITSQKYIKIITLYNSQYMAISIFHFHTAFWNFYRNICLALRFWFLLGLDTSVVTSSPLEIPLQVIMIFIHIIKKSCLKFTYVLCSCHFASMAFLKTDQLDSYRFFFAPGSYIV